MAIVAKEKNKDLVDNVLQVKSSDTDVKRKAASDRDRDNRSAQRNASTLLVEGDETREKGT